MLSNSGVGGEWISNAASPVTTNICTSGSSFQASYSFDVPEYHGDGHGYGTGRSFENGRVIAGYYEYATGDGGVTLSFRSTTERLTTFTYRTTAPHQHRAKNPPPADHSVITSTAHTPATHSCSENKYLFSVYGGSGSRIAVGAVVVLVSALVVLVL
jgi:hypothetical protein